MQRRIKITIIGGGTGSFNVLSALRDSGHELSAVVNMSDHGGSSGVLRDELGVLPPGDIRQCLVALAKSPDYLRELFTHRFANGTLRGHNFGNLFIAACQDLTGSFEEAIRLAGEVLQIQGRVIPVTLKNTELYARLKNGSILEGEPNISHSSSLQKIGLERIFLKPKAEANPQAIEAILNADLIIVAPGNLYGSLIPNLLVKGIYEALQKSRAKKVYISNLMTKYEETGGFCVHKFAAELEKWAGGPVFDLVLYNNKTPPLYLIKKYRREGDFVEYDGKKCRNGIILRNSIKFLAKPLIANKLFLPKKEDPLAHQRSLIRHDKDLLSRAIASII